MTKYKSVLCLLVCSMPIIGCEIVTIHHDEKPFNVIAVHSLEELNAIPKEIGLDFRVEKTDTDWKASCLRGITLDPDYLRTKVFSIKDGTSVIGVATLVSVPFKHLHKFGYLVSEAKTVKMKSIASILGIEDPTTFFITPGWFYLLPPYRGTGLGATIVDRVVLPAIQDLIKEFSENNRLWIECAALGKTDQIMRNTLHTTWKAYCDGSHDEVLENATEVCDILSKKMPTTFTTYMAQKLGLETLPAYNLTLGPVFIKQIS